MAGECTTGGPLSVFKGSVAAISLGCVAILTYLLFIGAIVAVVVYVAKTIWGLA